jgi:hypothetical protein
MSGVAAPSLSSQCFPKNYEVDCSFHEEAIGLFLHYSGYSPDFPFAELTLPEQLIVLHMARLLKQEAAR